VGARPVLYTLGKLEVPEDLKKSWLPEDEYVNVVQYPGDEWPHPSIVVERWENEVLTEGG
jgi:putative spermidine/putrescine transport system substrate-binding protein